MAHGKSKTIINRAKVFRGLAPDPGIRNKVHHADDVFLSIHLVIKQKAKSFNSTGLGGEAVIFRIE